MQPTSTTQPQTPEAYEAGTSTQGGLRGSTAVQPTSTVQPERGGKDEERRRRKDEAAHRRVEGLIAAIAARSRGLGNSWRESDARASLAAGVITVHDLQMLLDDLEIITQPAATRPRPRS